MNSIPAVVKEKHYDCPGCGALIDESDVSPKNPQCPICGTTIEGVQDRVIPQKEKTWTRKDVIQS